MAEDQSKGPGDIIGKPYFNPGRTRGLVDGSNSMANNQGLYIEFYNVNTDLKVAFKAFLTEFTDSFDLQLTSQNKPMSGLTTRSQTGISRQIGVGIAIPAASSKEAQMNLRNVSLLTKMLHMKQKDSGYGLTPTLDTANEFRIRFLNLIMSPDASNGAFGSAKETGLAGYLDDVQYKIALEDEGGGWLADRGSNGNKPFDFFVYPKLINLTFSFFPLTSKPIGWVKKGDGSMEFTYPNYPYGYKGVKVGNKQISESSFEGVSTNKISEVDEHRMNKALNRRK
jgi:hypothetical protein